MIKQLIRGITVAASVTVAAAGVQAEQMDTLNFGIISTESSQNLRTVWEPFLEDMSKQLDMEVNAFFAPDYAGIIQGMRFDKVDVAWYGNKSAMEAVDRAGGEIFAQTVDVSGNPGYWSLLIAHQDDDRLNSVEDVLARAGELTFGNGDPNSTSGFLVPGYYVFAMNGVDAKSAFKRTLNSSHETNALAVANKQLDVATFNTESYGRLKETQPEKAEKLKVIWKSPLIPSDPLVWRKNLPDETKQRISNFIFSYGTEDAREKEVLAGLQWAPFKASSNDQLIPIRQLALFKEKATLESADNPSESDKARLSTINNELKELDRRAALIEKQQAAAK
ncbi:phosphonate ABC transporter substrate-binding protein [Alloalcanivorax xenomutans]|jgi:phosphonate transport system substrate-binding protein|uniref:Phosphonate ABC transporter substrate-binding protein n=1 Tax=Alloalcanivorax xenomutans TaxID=1094342 RepID=A0A9Q3ZGM8_9GAMM|nr:phosphonate ABC transporter substrate-binding protein [Alloalcanivorax xenomutans]MCE7511216.1 phosphonate ABC transporter substrate-binding protein [Alloalcanivorax xenomutans]